MRVGILGGSYNPVHIGHLRLALEALENPLPDSTVLDRLDLVPSACPPHKSACGLLPFALRLAMLKAAVQGTPLRVNTLEGEREGPSYTWDTLCAYQAALPGARLVFFVGGEDFDALPAWYRGLELPELADIVMFARGEAGRGCFDTAVARHWPLARTVGNSVVLPSGGCLYYMPLPRLDVSASDLRQRWLDGHSVRFLVPDAVLDILEAHRVTVTDCWNEVYHC